MSYILEALEKLEENRRKTELPGHPKAPGQTAERPHRLRFLPYLLVAALLVNAGIFLWWLHPWERAVPAAVLSTTALPEVSDRSLANRPQPAEEKSFSQRQDSTQTVVGGIREENGNVSPAPAEAGRRTDGVVRETSRVYSLNDLPPAVRQDLPAIAISGHSYSADPSQRLVLINGSTMREGQVITNGLRLEQITSDGVILSFQGYRLRKGVF